MKQRIVKLVHEYLKEHLKKQSYAVDATVGNGFDTVFLAKHCLGVMGFDIQECAINKTKAKLLENGLYDKVALFHESHKNIRHTIPQHFISNIQVVMFNLGYLPGGDKQILTTSKETDHAIKSCMDYICEGGFLSIVAYPGHYEGKRERDFIVHETKKNLEGFLLIKNIISPQNGPHWMLFAKKAE